MVQRAILYIGINPPEKSARDAVYIAQLEKEGVLVHRCVDNSPGVKKFVRLWRTHRPLRGRYEAVFVGHMSTMVVPFARLMCRGKIVFNALNPLWDGFVLERGIYRRYSLGAALVWLADVVALHTAHITLLETEAQVRHVARAFFVPRRKLMRIFTTVDPSVYHPDPAAQKSEQFLCVLRGYLTPTTGAEYIVDAAHLLRAEDIRFRFIVRGEWVARIKERIAELGLTSVELIEEYLPAEELRRRILEGHVYLGQFSAHERLERTIQFKTVEALAMGLPYITADLPANRELLREGIDSLWVPRADAQSLARAIMRLKGDAALCARLSTGAYARYQEVLAPQVLVREVRAALGI